MGCLLTQHQTMSNGLPLKMLIHGGLAKALPTSLNYDVSRITSPLPPNCPVPVHCDALAGQSSRLRISSPPSPPNTFLSWPHILHAPRKSPKRSCRSHGCPESTAGLHDEDQTNLTLYFRTIVLRSMEHPLGETEEWFMPVWKQTVDECYGSVL